MGMKRSAGPMLLLAISAVIVALLVGSGKNGFLRGNEPALAPVSTVEADEEQDETIDSEAAPIARSIAESPSPASEPAIGKSFGELVAAYRDIPIIDAHNHDAGGQYRGMLDTWEKTGIDRIVLFGNVSEPSAVATDKTAWNAYKEHPDLFIPFTSGINLLEPSGVDALRANLEKGYFGLGEIAAASSYSPVLANVAWKTEHPMDGVLPDIYALLAEYKAPVLLHIDPPNGLPIEKLKEALTGYPDTTFIFAHANAFNSPANVEMLLAEYPNLYADFFVGFTAFNPESANELADFVPLIQKYPDRIVLSTDSGFGIDSEEKAIEAIYRLIDELGDRELAKRIAYDNMEALISRQPATETQLAAIRELGGETAGGLELETLTKQEAGRILIEAGKGL